jgi:Zn-dependent protease/CBS domain-containing protein
MKWSFHLARISGIDVRVHATFLLLLAFYGFGAFQQGGLSAAVFGVSFIVVLFACVLLHEFGHALAARRYGIRTPDITLLPIGGLARLERMPEKPGQELVVAAAGPAVNVVIAIILVLLGARIGGVESVTPEGTHRISVLDTLLAVNLLLVAFNLLPAFPMDGGRMLRALLAYSMDRARATSIAATVGQGFAVLLGIVGLFSYNFILVLIAVFIYFGANQEATLTRLQAYTHGLTVSDFMIERFETLSRGAVLQDAVDLLLSGSQHEFPVVAGDGTVAGVLTREDMVKGLREGGPSDSVVTHMHTGIPTVHVNDAFETAHQTMSTCDCPAVPVLDSNGRLVGMITPENLGELMIISSALTRGKTRGGS